METWIEWARGPFFVFAFTFMVLGLLRLAVLTLLAVRRTMRRAGDGSLPWGQILLNTLKWLIPVTKLRNRLLFGLTSMLFHVAIIVVPLFLAGHIALWARGLGVSWPAIPNHLADVLTVIAVVCAFALVVQRAAATATRELSRFQDFVIPILVAAPFASGFLLMHPAVNPFAHEITVFVHVMSGNLLFALIPITKLSHISLMPTVQLVSEVAWHWPPDGGSKVGATLGKEGQPV